MTNENDALFITSSQCISRRNAFLCDHVHQFDRLSCISSHLCLNLTFQCQDQRKLPKNKMNNVAIYLCESLLLPGAIRPLKPSRAAVVPGDFAADEDTDWLGMLWSLATSLVAPDEEEEEGIHQLTETLTCKKTFHSLALLAC